VGSNHILRKILLAVNESDQALEAVRYVAGMVPPDSTQIVLFHVGTEYPEVFWDMDRNPLYRSKMPKVMGWLADRQLVIGEFKEKAVKILTDAGFPEDAVQVKTQTKKTSLVRDIVQESYQNFSAVVLGRTGTSRLKDLLIGSLAAKLVNRIKHIPLIIVGGRPVSQKILIALDKTIEAMRSVNSVVVLAGVRDHEIILYHTLRLPGMFRKSTDKRIRTERVQDWLEYSRNKFKPCMDEATHRLTKAGITADRISRNYAIVKGNPVPQLVEEAQKEECGAIVVGRREVISFAEEYISGRFSLKVLNLAERMAVWIVN